MASARWLAFALLFGACSSAASIASPNIEDSQPLVVPNHGGSLEGHTPRGFAGMGGGLFAGDNLNPSFPEGDGVQLFLTFQLFEEVSNHASAVLASDALVVSGSPFEDLGPLSAEIVSYDSFGPDLFDTPGLSNAVECTRVGETGLECDVGELVGPLLAAGETTVQFRLLFERPADNDGQQDLAMFFRSDPNASEAGLFTLTVDR